MSTRSQDVLLGSVAIGMVTLLVLTVMFVEPLSRPPTRQVVLRFRHDEGLAPIKAGSPVILSGAIQVGKVTHVILVEHSRAHDDDGRPATLMVEVRADVDRRVKLYRDCKVTTDQPPVGGVGNLVILDVGSPAHAELAAGDVLRGLPPQSFAAAIGTLSRRLLSEGGLVDKLDRMVDDQAEGSLAYKLQASFSDINAMTAALRDQLSPAEQYSLMSKVHRIADGVSLLSAELARQTRADEGGSAVAKAHLALDRLAEGLAEVNLLLQESRPLVRDTLGHVAGVAQKLDGQIAPALVAELDRDDPGGLLGKLHLSMDRVATSMANVVEITDTGRRIIVLNRPALDRTIGNLKDASDQLRVGVQELLLAPWRLLGAPPASERARLEAFDAARRFAEAAAYLDDAVARLEALAAAAPPGAMRIESDEELRAVHEALQAAFDRFRTAEEFFWQKLK